VVTISSLISVQWPRGGVLPEKFGLGVRRASQDRDILPRGGEGGTPLYGLLGIDFSHFAAILVINTV